MAFAAWVGFQKDPVSAQLWGYDVVNDSQVAVNLDVVRPDPVAVECTVYAQAADHSIVGREDRRPPGIRAKKRSASRSTSRPNAAPSTAS